MPVWVQLVGVVVVVAVSIPICLAIARRHGDRRPVWGFFGLTGILLTAVLVRSRGARERRDSWEREREQPEGPQCRRRSKTEQFRR